MAIFGGEPSHPMDTAGLSAEQHGQMRRVQAIRAAIAARIEAIVVNPAVQAEADAAEAEWSEVDSRHRPAKAWRDVPRAHPDWAAFDAASKRRYRAQDALSEEQRRVRVERETLRAHPAFSFPLWWQTPWPEMDAKLQRLESEIG